MNSVPFLVVTVAALAVLLPTMVEPIQQVFAQPFIGEVKMFAGNFAPRGYAFCNGTLLPIAQNTALFSLYGTTYGGDGRTTFGLPDCEGRAVVHPGNGPGLTNYRLGEKFGQQFVTLSQNQIPSHTHSIDPSSITPTDEDSDLDGLTDFIENLITNTDPNNPDTDGDGIQDGQEVMDGTNPNLSNDTDGDGLTDNVEINFHGTDPANPDTDGGGVEDGIEVIFDGTDPLNPLDDAIDTDGDGLSDSNEGIIGTDPANPDTDGGGVEDGIEVIFDGTDPLNPLDDATDTDGDGLTDFEEINIHGTDPANPDTDGDGLTDGTEVTITQTDPTKDDTDMDGILDKQELQDGTNPDDTNNDLLRLMTSDSRGTPNPSSDSILSRAYPRWMSSADSTVEMTSIVSTMTLPQGGGQQFSNMQPFLGINHIVALEGLFPSRS